MTSQQSRNYTSIEVIKADMNNLYKKVDHGFSDIKEELVEMRKEIKENYVHKSDFVLIKYAVVAALGLSGTVITTIIIAALRGIVGLG